MARFFFRLDGGDSLDFHGVIYFIFNIGPGVGVGVGVDQEPGVGAGVGVGTAPPRLRTPVSQRASHGVQRILSSQMLASMDK